MRVPAFLSAVLFLSVGVAFAADPAPPVVNLPEVVVVPEAGTPTKLTGAELYVFDGNTPCVVTTSPRGILAVTREAGPLKVKGIFAGGTGKVETRSFAGKYVWMVDVVATGRAELLVFPPGIIDEAGILRRTIDANHGPLPPPVPTTLTLSASPATGTAPLAVTFAATGMAGKGSLDFGDFGGLQTLDPAAPLATHIYTKAGSFTATLTADGKAATAGVVVTGVVPPVVPLTPFQLQLQAAFRADGATAKELATYAALWRGAGKTTVYDTGLTTPAAVLAEIQVGAANLSKEPNPSVRHGILAKTARVVADELNPLMPKPANGSLTQPTRDSMAGIFARIAADLEIIKGN